MRHLRHLRYGFVAMLIAGIVYVYSGNPNQAFVNGAYAGVVACNHISKIGQMRSYCAAAVASLAIAFPPFGTSVLLIGMSRPLD